MRPSSNMKKILVAYDGSPAADAAIQDLIRACLPTPVTALVLSIADVWLPPEQTNASSLEAENRNPATRLTDQDIYAQARHVLEESRATAVRGARTLSALFPYWQISSEGVAESPGWALVQKARTWEANLVVAGAHSHSAFQRLFFGSAAAKVVAEASCSVRISRLREHPHHRKLRIIAAVDGSSDAEEVIREIANRIWPSSTEIRVVTVLDSKLESLVSSGGLGQHWVQDHVGGIREWACTMTGKFVAQLRSGEHTVEPYIYEGDPKKVLLHEAEAWDADCIFIGARGLSHGKRWLLGSVASAVASRSHCSVEVVRSP